MNIRLGALLLLVLYYTFAEIAAASFFSFLFYYKLDIFLEVSFSFDTNQSFI